ncbi:MAG: hypothetical protein U0T84_00710 [Chitinophagales bacterium]
MKRIVLIGFIGVGLLLLAACKKTNYEFASDYLLDYAPNNVGHYVVYDVDSIRYKFILPSTQLVDTIRYQLKEELTDTFYDNLGRMVQRLEVSRRSTSVDAWSLDRVWYSYRSGTVYEKVENDWRFIKLVFPPLNGVTWSGNSYLPANDTTEDAFKVFANWKYEYADVNTPGVINGLQFDSTLTVNEVNEENLIDKKKSVARYARQVGLIYKEWQLINKQDVTSTWDNPQQANGFRIFMRVNSYQR